MLNRKISKKDKERIRILAKKVAEISALPVQKEKKEMWILLNKLERVRPLIQIKVIDDNLWKEIIPPEEFKCEDDFCRKQEFELLKIIYQWENFRDDRVIEDVIICPIVINGGNRNTGFGIKVNFERPDNPRGAFAIRSVIVEEKDIEKIKIDCEISVDWEETEKNFQLLSELYEGILKVEKKGPNFFWFEVMDLFIRWRGIEQTFIDMIERPKWLHQCLEKITIGYLKDLEQLEKLNLLSPGNGNVNLGSGGYGWTDQLPQADFDGKVRIKDLWARAATQIFTEGVSPQMHEEFAIQYEKRILEKFGLACYGCCEPLHKKMHIVRKIKNLRRVSMSPWVDIEIASSELGKDYVFTHKPNPSFLSMEKWNPELIKQKLKECIEKTRNNIVEIVLQDIHNIRGEPYRLSEWSKISFELAEKYA